MFVVSDHDFVQKGVASIAVLKAATMRTLWGCNDAIKLLNSIRFLQDQLRDWYGRLPLEAQLIQLGTAAHVPLKTSIYYLHLLHLGAVMLIFRHCLAGVRGVEDRKRLSDEQRTLMDKTLHDGLVAAQHSARMIHMIREASESVRHCWITMYIVPPLSMRTSHKSRSLTMFRRFQSYVSGMILLYNAAQLSLAGLDEATFAVNLDLASKTIEVLNFCGQLDPVARKFAISLLTHYERLREISPAGGADIPPKVHFGNPQASYHLFFAPPDDAKLHDTSRSLFEQLCNPYANENATTERQEHGARSRSSRNHTLNSHQESQDCAGSSLPGEDDTGTTITAGISNLEDGYFVGSNEPVWWSGKRSAVEFSSGATTLETL
jgi:hypothetical protein